MYKIILLLHILGATIWTGGHLVLSLCILPRVFAEKSPARLLDFESAYEKIGMPALIIQVASGLWLAHGLMPDFEQWFRPDDAISRLILVKIMLLVLTIALAAHARLSIIPRLDTHNLKSLACHIIAVTILSVLFVVTGLGFRTGGVI